MSPGLSREEPVFFVDRSLGRIGVPTALRAAGIQLVTLAEVYGVPADEDVQDSEWLSRAGIEGWPVLMKDQRIRYRPAERAALEAGGVRAFCLANGSLPRERMAAVYWPSIVRALADTGPFLYAVSQTGLRRVGLTRSPD